MILRFLVFQKKNVWLTKIVSPFGHFGSKTDSENYIQSGWKLLSNTQNKILDPVSWLKQLIDIGNTRRLACSSDRLFVTINGPAKAASRTVIAGWIKSVLKEAGIHTTPGSFRSAVASRSWLENESLEVIMSRANWRSENTFKKFYRKELRTTQCSMNKQSLTNLFQPIQ